MLRELMTCVDSMCFHRVKYKKCRGVGMIKEFANEICDFLMNIPEVKSCSLYGSLSKGTFDE